MDISDVPAACLEAQAALRWVLPRLSWFQRHIRAGRTKVQVLPQTPGRAQGLAHSAPECFLVLRGANQVAAGDARITVRKGEVLLVPAGVPHSETFVEDDGLFAFLVFCFYEKEVAGLLLTVQREGRRSDPFFLRLYCREREHLESLLTQAAHAGWSGQRRARARMRFLMQAFLAALADWLPNAVPLDRGAPLAGRCRFQMLLRLSDPELSVASLARELECHPDHLSRVMRREAGMTLNRLIREERLRYAAQLLRTSDSPIKVIARKVGFRDPGYFQRCFLRVFGHTPRNCRGTE